MKHSTYSVLPLDVLARLCRSAASTIGLAPGRLPYNAQIRWVIGFVAGCCVLVGATLLVLWALSGFGSLGVSGHGLVALILGIVFTSALGIALMALSFYGDHNDKSDDVRPADAEVERDAE